MELRQVEYVLAVVDHGSFTAGASALRVAQPSLSEAVRKLEADLGTALFHRVGRSVTLTDAGRAFVGPARQLLRDRTAVEESVAAIRALHGGRLDLVALPTLAVDPLAVIVGRFRSKYPGIAVHIAEPEHRAAVEEMVTDGRCEVGLTELPLRRRRDLVSVRLAEQEIVAVCPPGTRLTAPGRLPVARIAGMPLVATPAGTSTRDLLDRALAAARVTPTVAVETAQREAIGPLVLAGAGTSFLPRRLAEGLAAQGAVIARLVPGLTRTIGLVYRGPALTPAAREFVALSREADGGGRRVQHRS